VAPAVANVVTRVVTDEGWTDLRLRPRRREWPVWIVAWLAPVLLVLVGIGAYALLVPAAVDPTLGTLRTADNAIKVIKQEQRSMLIRGFRNGISKLQYDQSHCPMHSS